MPIVNRRKFLSNSLLGLSALYVSTVLPGCGGLTDQVLGNGSFKHGIASGDPLHDSVILWSRITPAGKPKSLIVAWDVALDSEFNDLVVSDLGKAEADNDYCVKVDIRGLQAGTRYYYRFRTENNTSATGHTCTLPEGDSQSLRMAVLSCANYPAGYFHVYREVANTDNLDLVLHLGDYIYEYGKDGYASEQAEAIGRVADPTTELLKLTDYRKRYAQYRTDIDLQAAHAAAPFLLVWDDHEVANDAWEFGAENHSDDEGNYSERKAAAMRAYFEWLPIRPTHTDLTEPSSIYRQFQWGNLANILMLDTRHEGRNAPLALASYFDTAGGFNRKKLFEDIDNPEREMLGTLQRDWLETAVATSSATWQLLAQQVLMGKIYLPFAVATQQLSIDEYAKLGDLASLAGRQAAGDPTLTEEELDRLAEGRDQLTEEVEALLKAAPIPYNLDAWDGFGAEREKVFNIAKNYNANLVVLSGDTHNAWANNLQDADKNPVGVEFATGSVSSPGLEAYLGIEADAFAATEAGIVSLVPPLKYVNVGDRGLMVLDVTPEAVTANWHFVSSVLKREYTMQDDRSVTMQVLKGTHVLQSIERNNA